MISHHLPEEKNGNESVNTHKDNENEKEKKKGSTHVYIYHYIRYIKVEENTKVSYKGRTDSAIESMQAPPALILFPV